MRHCRSRRRCCQAWPRRGRDDALDSCNSCKRCQCSCSPLRNAARKRSSAESFWATQGSLSGAEQVVATLEATLLSATALGLSAAAVPAVVIPSSTIPGGLVVGVAAAFFFPPWPAPARRQSQPAPTHHGVGRSPAPSPCRQALPARRFHPRPQAFVAADPPAGVLTALAPLAAAPGAVAGNGSR